MRDSRIDVARGILILGVVVGHFWERSDGWDGGVLRLALTGLYAFHMPAFVFLTGMVAKPQHTGRKLLGLLSVLMIFQLVFIAFLALTGHPLREWYWPYWVLWFIMAMIWWQLITPLISRWPRATFALAILAALLIGLAGPAGNWFTYQRAVVFLPFYVAGMAWGPQLVSFVRSRAAGLRLTLVVAFLASIAGIAAWDPEPHWLFQNWTYSQLGVDPGTGAGLRLAVLAVGALGTVSLMAVIPSRARSLAWIGQRTLPVFILHVFVVLLYDWLVFPLFEDVRGSLLFALGIVLGSGVAFALASRPFVAATDAVRRLPEQLLPTYHGSASVAVIRPRS